MLIFFPFLLLLPFSPTEESYQKTVEVDNKRVPIEVIDTAGQEEFASFRDLTLQFGEVSSVHAKK